MSSLKNLFPQRLGPAELQEMYPAGTTFGSIVTNVRAGEAVSTQGYKYNGLFIDGVHNGKGFTHSYRNTHVAELLTPALDVLGIDTEGPDPVKKLGEALIGQEVEWTLKYPKFVRSNPRFVPTAINGNIVKKATKRGKKVVA